MPKQVKIWDKEDKAFIIRNAVDAREIVETGKGRYSAKVPKRQEETPDGPPVIDPAAAQASSRPGKNVSQE